MLAADSEHSSSPAPEGPATAHKRPADAISSDAVDDYPSPPADGLSADNPSPAPPSLPLKDFAATHPAATGAAGTAVDPAVLQFMARAASQAAQMARATAAEPVEISAEQHGRGDLKEMMVDGELEPLLEGNVVAPAAEAGEHVIAPEEAQHRAEGYEALPSEDEGNVETQSADHLTPLPTKLPAEDEADRVIRPVEIVGEEALGLGSPVGDDGLVAGSIDSFGLLRPVEMDGEDFVIGEEGEMLLEPEAEVDDDDAFEDGEEDDEDEEVEHELDSDGDLREDGEEDTGYEGDMNSDVDDEPELEAAEGEVLVPPRSTGSNGAPSILEEVWNSVFEPGVNSKVVMVMDMCFYGLFGILLALFFASGFNPHVAFLEVVAVCLWVSVKWFLAESAKIQAVEQGNTDPSKPGDTTPADGSVTPSVGNTTPEEAIAPVETKKTI